MAELNENSKVSGNSHKGRTLKRMKIVYGNKSVQFAINPEDYTQTEPNKATITQTKGGAWIDAWGAGITEISIKGITGVKGTTTNVDTGYQRWKELRNLIRSVYESVKDGEQINDLVKFYNFTDNEFWYCYPNQSGIELYRSKSRPNVYQYTINLWALRRMGQPAVSSGIIGNVNKSSGKPGGIITSKNTVTKAGGGGDTGSRGLLRNPEVDNSTVTNTKTKSIAGLQDDCLAYMTHLEPLIGGKAGKISPITGFQCSQGITMQASGTISNVTSFTGKDLHNTLDLMLSEVRFVSRVSMETHELFTKIISYSPDVLSPAYSSLTGMTPKQRVIQAVSNSTNYGSTIYDLIVKYKTKSVLSRTEVNHIKVIMLECMMVYQELYRLYNETVELSTTLTMTSISLLINNIRAMIMYLSIKDNGSDKYHRMDVSAELRKLEKVMTQVRTDIVDYL